MCKRGPKLTVVHHKRNHPTTFGRNFECAMIFVSLRPFRVRFSVVRVLGLVLGLVLSLEKCFMFNTLKKIGGRLHSAMRMIGTLLAHECRQVSANVRRRSNFSCISGEIFRRRSTTHYGTVSYDYDKTIGPM